MKIYVYFFDGWWRFSDKCSQLKGAFRTREEAEAAAMEALSGNDI